MTTDAMYKKKSNGITLIANATADGWVAFVVADDRGPFSALQLSHTQAKALVEMLSEVIERYPVEAATE